MRKRTKKRKQLPAGMIVMDAAATATPSNAQEWVAHFDAQATELHSEAEAIQAAAAQNGGVFSAEMQQRYDALMGPPDGAGQGLIQQAVANGDQWRGVVANSSRAAGRVAQRGSGQLTTNQAALSAVDIPAGVHTGYSMGQFVMESTRPVRLPREAGNFRMLPVGCETPEEAYAAGMALFACVFEHPTAVEFCQSHGIEYIRMQDQSVGTPDRGGNLVPIPLERSIIRIRELNGIMRSRCRRYPMTAGTLKLPKDLGGITVVPVDEGANMKSGAGTNKTWSRPELIARKWGGYTTWTTELSDDAIIDVAADLANDYGEAFAFAEDNALFNGDGTPSTYNSITGIRNALLASSKKVLPAKATPELKDITSDMLLELMGMPPNIEGPDENAWYCHKTVWAGLIQPIAVAGGGNTISDLERGSTTRPGGTGRQPNFVFQGSPGYWVNSMPRKADVAAELKGIVIYGSLRRGVAYGDRRGVQVRTSEHAEFESDMLAIRGTERFDLKVHETGTATANDPAGTVVQIDFGPAS